MKIEKKFCPICNNELATICIYWCYKCKKWFEDIDFLDPEIKFDEDCKKCSWLAETGFEKNNLTMFVCNSLKSKRKMEKIRDFRRCKEFDGE